MLKSRKMVVLENLETVKLPCLCVFFFFLWDSGDSSRGTLTQSQELCVLLAETGTFRDLKTEKYQISIRALHFQWNKGMTAL